MDNTNWISLMPPFIAIVLAIVSRKVIISLLIACLVSLWYFHGNLFTAFASFSGDMIPETLADTGHISVIVFSLLIAAMVHLLNINGAMTHLVVYITQRVRSAIQVQMAIWFSGLLLFFDDYANTLVIGSAYQKLADKYNLSREKLAYLVDSTSAPIASIALISTWIGAELGYIADAIQKEAVAIQQTPYELFINSLAYSYYPILTLFFIPVIIYSRREIGPMHALESRKKQSAPADELIYENSIKLYQVFLAILPVALMLAVTFYYMYLSGRENSEEPATLSSIMGNADAYSSLMVGAGVGLLSAFLLSISYYRKSFSDMSEGIFHGMSRLLEPVAILTLAWTLSTVMEKLDTAGFIVSVMQGSIQPEYLPLITFITAAVVSFSTGSSWGTMAILFPIILAPSWVTMQEAGWDSATIFPVFYSIISGVLSGSIFGDHCSPISDTTILSSMASGCDHISHVKTQIPYALITGGVSILLLIMNIIVPGTYQIIVFLVGFILLGLSLRIFGKPVLR